MAAPTLRTYSNNYPREDLSDILHDIDPIFDEYRCRFEPVPKTGDYCRHLMVAEHTETGRVYQITGEHSTVRATAVNDCSYEQMQMIRRMSKQIRHRQVKVEISTDIQDLLENLL